MSYEEAPCPERGEDHCEHFYDWPMAEGQTERYGDPGDGLGVQGCCCKCPSDQPDDAPSSPAQTENAEEGMREGEDDGK